MSQNARNHIDHWVQKYPKDQKQSAVIAALTFVQEENNGSLTNELIEAVAGYLGMPKIAVYEVATFYSMFELKPVGKYKICVCTNISCMLCGSQEIVDHLKVKLGINLGQTTPDGKFTLKSVECLAACCGAPAMQIGADYYENLTLQKVDEILAAKE
ncbi:MAG: NADH-quinone oxidoreductase subunit NuoE [Proteobacteria bacterium]|nr:NADH-quinone oxidoreductase subunit NuoE [Pseudomonadota bacterium]